MVHAKVEVVINLNLTPSQREKLLAEESKRDKHGRVPFNVSDELTGADETSS